MEILNKISTFAPHITHPSDMRQTWPLDNSSLYSTSTEYGMSHIEDFSKCTFCKY